MLIAQLRIFFEGLLDDLFHFLREIGIQAHRRHGRAAQDRVENYGGAFAAERQRAGGHFVEDGAEGEKSERASSARPRACSGDM